MRLLAPPAPTFSVETTRFDENYRPSDHTRITTNFANLARGEAREQNLRCVLSMIANRFNQLAHWDNEGGDRYSVDLDIVSGNIVLETEPGADSFPLLEMLQTTIVDHSTGRRSAGVVGNNFSSYIRDYDFSIVLPSRSRSEGSVPDDFGDLHGRLFQKFLRSDAYTGRFPKPPVICLSVSSNRVYRRADNRHPILGVEYRQDEHSLTDAYFEKMGLRVRYFMPPNSVAPLAFYHVGDLLSDYSNLELIGVVSVMETFQKIYRPEIYNANSAAGAAYRPSLHHADYSVTQVSYDREERSRLAVEQGRFVEQNLITPHRAVLEQWSLTDSAPTRERKTVAS